MAKKEKGSEVEYLRGLVKQQKSIIRNLQKEVSRTQKKNTRYENTIDLQKDEEFKEKLPIEKDQCPKCNADVSFTDIGNRRIYSCTECSYRKSKRI